MAKVGKRVGGKKRQTRARALAKKVSFTLGDLIAAAFDAVGTEAQKVAKVISSKPMSSAIGRKIVLV